MGCFTDISGERFHRLVAIRREHNPNNGKVDWLCRCDCGNATYASLTDLVRGKKKSCGCLKSDYLTNKNHKHGKSGTRLDVIYTNMVQRCYNTKNHHYKNYGERGIKVCDDWLGKNGRKSFFKWAEASGYKDSLFIDRIDNNGNYSPNNCRWVTQKENQNNKTSNHFIEINGERKTISQWSEIYGISTYVISRRLYLGWNEAEAVTTPKLKNRRNK